MLPEEVVSSQAILLQDLVLCKLVPDLLYEILVVTRGHDFLELLLFELSAFLTKLLSCLLVDKVLELSVSQEFTKDLLWILLNEIYHILNVNLVVLDLE